MKTPLSSSGAFCLALASTIAAGSAAWALGLKTGNQDAKATAAGNAFAATADNPSAIYYNPAGLTQLVRDEFSLGAYFLSYQVDYEGPLGQESSEAKVYTLPHLYYGSHVKDSSLAWGLGVYSPYGLGSKWSDTGHLRNFATETELKYVTLAPMLAGKLTDTFSIGAGPTINYGDAHLARGLLLPGDEFLFEGDGFGFGGNFGIRWQPVQKHALGLTYRSPVTVEFEGETSFKSAVPAFIPSFTGDGSTELTMPAQVVAGYSFRPTKHWNLEANVEWTQWSSFDSLAISSVAGTFTEPMNWEDSYVISTGITRNFDSGTWVSAGYWWAQQTTPDSTYNPRVPDAALNVFSVGAGYETEQWRVGLTYQLGLGAEREVSGSPTQAIGPNADGTYQMTTQAVAVTLGYKF